MQVLKFGGSSLHDADAIRHVAGLIREESARDRILVVCSACGGVTNALVRIVELVRSGQTSRALDEFDALAVRHLEISANLKGVCELPATPSEIHRLMAATQASISGATALTANSEWSDWVLSFGERISVRLVALALNELGIAAKAIDASELIVTNDQFGAASPILDETHARASRNVRPLLQDGIVPVVTGFIGATRDARITTLGRNSSDFSATLLAAAIGADEVSIWTDVDGVFDRDPRNGADTAVFLDELSYEEAINLARSGAKVLHPQTLEPLIGASIPVRIRNTFNPRHTGTWIGPELRSIAV
ncbi:MAG TPA: aspartate kinase [Candidatus Acidoferrales bacterium]|nr:aspartate kinase [Candidatus Acidoferrales bacterium]